MCIFLVLSPREENIEDTIKQKVMLRLICHSFYCGDVILLSLLLFWISLFECCLFQQQKEHKRIDRRTPRRKYSKLVYNQHAYTYALFPFSSFDCIIYWHICCIFVFISIHQIYFNGILSLSSFSLSLCRRRSIQC